MVVGDKFIDSEGYEHTIMYIGVSYVTTQVIIEVSTPPQEHLVSKDKVTKYLNDKIGSKSIRNKLLIIKENLKKLQETNNSLVKSIDELYISFNE